MMETLEPGQHVTDKETGKTLVILDIFDTSSTDYVIIKTPPADDDRTLDSSNPSYEVSDTVVDCVYFESLSDRYPDLSIPDLLEDYDPLSDSQTGEFETVNLRVYSFPLSRIE